MRFYTQQHPFYCGIDLHARTMYVCILALQEHLTVNFRLARTAAVSKG